MHLDLERVRAHARRTTTEELLDRVTAYRAGMEPEAVAILEEELQRRGLGPEAIAAHQARSEGQWLRLADGSARRCSFCERPACVCSWGWHRLGGVLPVFPRRFYRCVQHTHPVAGP